MHPESTFLSQFKSISQLLIAEPREKINQLAILLSENNAFLDESNETIDMINALSETIENDFSDTSLQLLQKSLFLFWRKLIVSKKMDIFFFGHQTNATFFFELLDKENAGNLFYIDVNPGESISTESFSQPLLTSTHPVIIYDHGAEAVKNLDEVRDALLIADFQQVMMLKALPFSDSDDVFISFLQHKHNQTVMKKPPTLIMGNSYGYYAYPHSCLNKSVNLSMHSLDIRQAQTMLSHYAESKKLKTVILTFGYFDIFYELYKTRMQENIRVVHIVSHYNHKNNILPYDSIATDFLHASDEALLAHFLPMVRNSERLANFNLKLDDAATLGSISANLEEHIQGASSLPQAVFEETSKSRAALHNKSYKYKKSKEVNAKIISEMCALAKDKGIRIHYVIPPFPDAYLQSLEPRMIEENRAFLKSLESYHFNFHDFNEDKSFNRTDFRDGDHLNYHGAVKLVKTLKKRGVLL